MRRFNPLLNLETDDDRADYFRLVLFLHMVKMPAVQEVLQRVVLGLPENTPDSERASLRQRFDEALEAALAADTSLAVGNAPGSRSADPNAGPAATTYDLRQITGIAADLNFVVRCARQLPAVIMPAEARPTAGFMVKLEGVAANQAEQRDNN